MLEYMIQGCSGAERVGTAFSHIFHVLF